MRKNRQAALNLVLQHEGGFAMRGSEPGGAVNMGISLQLLAEHYKRNRIIAGANLTALKHLTRKEAEAIYAQRFLDPIQFDLMPAGVDYCWLDFCVNSGIKGAIETMMEHLGVRQPGVLNWLMKHDPDDAITIITAARLERMKKHKNWPDFRKGWTARVTDVAAKAREMMQPAKVA